MFRLKISFNKKRLTVLLSTKSESSYAPGCYRLEDIHGHVTITKKACGWKKAHFRIQSGKRIFKPVCVKKGRPYNVTD